MPVTDFTPTLAQVGNATLQRTKDQFGNVTGTFSPETTPTDDQVTELTDRAADKVSMKVGTDIPESCWDDASAVVALRAAMMIELTYYAEQVTNQRSPYPLYKEQFIDGIADLQLKVQTARRDAEDGKVGGEQPYAGPRWKFPGRYGDSRTSSSEPLETRRL